MTECPSWMNEPVEFWDDRVVLAWLKEWRGESPLPVLYPLTAEEFLGWLTAKGHKADLAIRTFKYWMNEYYKEMRSADKP